MNVVTNRASCSRQDQTPANNTLIALGANLGLPKVSFLHALELIVERVGRLRKKSSLYWTEPVLAPDYAGVPQNEYLNAVILVESRKPIVESFEALLDIERRLGRDRGKEPGRWLSRVIDIDLLAQDDVVFSTPRLTLPHARLHERAFVITPLAEICPDWRHPQLGVTAEEMHQQLGDQGIIRVESW